MRKGWGLLASWRWLMSEGRTLLACTFDRRTPWVAKLAAVATVVYVVSPLDLIPDFIPVFGLLDDMLIIPMGLAVVKWLIPPEVWAQHARHAAVKDARDSLKTVGRGRA